MWRWHWNQSILLAIEKRKWNHLILETALVLLHTAELIAEPNTGSSQHGPPLALLDWSLLFFTTLAKEVSFYPLDRTQRQGDTKSLAVSSEPVRLNCSSLRFSPTPLSTPRKNPISLASAAQTSMAHMLPGSLLKYRYWHLSVSELLISC